MNKVLEFSLSVSFSAFEVWLVDILKLHTWRYVLFLQKALAPFSFKDTVWNRSPILVKCQPLSTN